MLRALTKVFAPNLLIKKMCVYALGLPRHHTLKLDQTPLESKFAADTFCLFDAQSNFINGGGGL